MPSYKPIATFSYTRRMKAVKPNNVRTFTLKGRRVKAVSPDGFNLQIIEAPKSLVPEIKSIKATGAKLVPYRDQLRIVGKPTGKVIDRSIIKPKKTPTPKKRKKDKEPPTTTIRTRKWGKISYPKGSNPLVIEFPGRKGAIDRIVAGYTSDEDLAKLRKELIQQGEAQLQLDQELEVMLNFPKTRKKPQKIRIQGRQPLLPRVIHHTSWPPDEKLVAEAKEKFRRNPNRKTASDLEAMIYFSTASMAAPLNDQGSRIYFYLFRRYLKEKGWKDFKAMPFLDEHKTLSAYDRGELDKMKRWIFKQQQKDLKERKKRLKQAGVT